MRRGARERAFRTGVIRQQTGCAIDWVGGILLILGVRIRLITPFLGAVKSTHYKETSQGGLAVNAPVCWPARIQLQQRSDLLHYELFIRIQKEMSFA